MKDESLIIKFEIITISILVLGWICLYFYIRNRKLVVTTSHIHDMQVPAIFLCVLVFLAFMGIASMNSGDRYALSATETSPTNVFCGLNPETSSQDLYNLAEIYEMCVLGPIDKNKGVDYYIMADTHYFSHKEENGILLKVRFQKDSDTIISAALTIRTKHGTAKCCFDNTGYTLSVKKSLLSFPQISYHDNVAEAVELAYSYVYPENDIG